MNPYLYARGNPTALVDPSGLVAITPDGDDTNCIVVNCNPPPTPTVTQTPTPSPTPTSGMAPGTPTPMVTPTPAPQTPPTPNSSAPITVPGLRKVRALLNKAWQLERKGRNNFENNSNMAARLYAAKNKLDCEKAGSINVCRTKPGQEVFLIPSDRGGVMVGDYFIVRHDRIVTPELLRHETKHADQWAVFGNSYPGFYFGAEGWARVYDAAVDGEHAPSYYNVFELVANSREGGYD